MYTSGCALINDVVRIIQFISVYTIPLEQQRNLRYAYDALGNVTAVRDYVNSNQVQSFGYDHLNRLTSAATNGVGSGQYSHSYAYNKIGNITSFAGVSYGYNSAAHKQAVTHLNSVQRFWYDANGNPSAWLRASMTKRVEGGVTYDPQVYDVQNRLVSVTKVGTGTTTFTYDAAGIRVKTVRPNGDTIYTPFPNYEEEVRGATTIKRSSYGLVGQTIALRVSGDPVSGNNGLFFYYVDHLGSTSIMLRSNGDFVSGSTARYHPLRLRSVQALRRLAHHAQPDHHRPGFYRPCAYFRPRPYAAICCLR
jgi:YD repeat-containing protein